MDQYKRVEVLEHRSSLLLRAIRLSDGAEVAIERVKAGFEWAMAVGDARGEAALAWAAARTTLCHAHVAPLLDALRDDNDLCFVTPLVRPGSRVFEGAALPLTPAAVAHAGYQLASELVVGGALVLCHDFKCIAPLVFGQVFNRPRFLAPERLLEDEFSTPADVWALGATLLQLATGHVAGGTSAARKTLVGFGDAPWTPHKALAGAYHDKFGGAEDEAGWSEACAAQRAAWDALGAPLRSLIEACLVLEPGGRATAADLLAHAAFEGVRGAPLVAAEGPQLEQHGGGGGGGGGASVVLHAAAAVGASAEALRSEAAAHTAQQQAGFSHHPALEAFVADLAACSALFVDDRHEPAPALPHCLFMGPPGTGKTTSARCLGRLLKDRGLLPLDDVVETTGWGLMGRFVGQTRGVVKALLQRALGGVLLIDEAHSLASRGFFETEARGALLGLIVSDEFRGKVVVVLAGSEAGLRELQDLEPALWRRLKQFTFSPLEPREAEAELVRVLRREGASVAAEALCTAGAEGAVAAAFGRLRAAPSWASMSDVVVFAKRLFRAASLRVAEQASGGGGGSSGGAAAAAPAAAPQGHWGRCFTLAHVKDVAEALVAERLALELHGC